MSLWSLSPWNRSYNWINSWDPFDDFAVPSLMIPSGGREGGDYPSGPLVKNDDSNFTVKMNVSNFAPEEINVKAVDDYLVVHGKHEQRKDNYGYVKREFTRRYFIPQDCQADKLSSSLSPNGILTIQAPKKPREIEGSKARSIPITFEQNTNKQVTHESDKKK